MEKLITPTDLKNKAQELINKGEMPSLEEVLKAVGEVREKYRDKILVARNPIKAGMDALR